MIAQAAHIPVHLGSMPASVAAAVAEFEEFFPAMWSCSTTPIAAGRTCPISP